MPAQRSTFANSTRPQVQTKTKRSPLDEFNFNTIPTTSTGDTKAKTQKKPLDTFESYDETTGGEYATEKVSVPEPSQSSDDGLMASIAAQMQASAEKKKKEKEGKFLVAAELALNEIINSRSEEFQDGVAEMDSIYADFQLAYAAADDEIRKLWVALMEELQSFQALLAEKRKNAAEQEKKREEKHIVALARCKKACSESQRLAESLSFSGKSV